MKTIILGIGNDIVKDDGVGIYTADLLKKVITNNNIIIETTHSAGIYILDFIEGYHKAILIDSIKTIDGEPGTIYKINLRDLKIKNRPHFLHTVDLLQMILLYKDQDVKLPTDITLYAIEAGDTSGFGEHLSPEVKKSAHKLFHRLKKELLLEI